MKRYLYDIILKDLKKKMVFLTGPRQVGKTYLAKQLRSEFNTSIYLNYDDVSDAKVIRERGWPIHTELVILDEIHKMKGWKNYLKGTFDTRADGQTFLITGSARMDTFRQAGDSLAGRYFHHSLNPISLKEVSDTMSPSKALLALNLLGGFPEPFLSGSTEDAQRWRRQYYTDLVREDILDFSRVHEVRTIKVLLEMLRHRVGSPLSHTSLAEDLQLAPNTVIKYVGILESLHIIFSVRPFHKNIARSLLKEPKIYFYDTGYVEGDEGIKLENTVAVSLLKHVQFLQDTKGVDSGLYYIRNKEGKEIDFVLTEKGNLKTCIEVKLSKSSAASSLKYFADRLAGVKMVQLVANSNYEHTDGSINIVPAADWLSRLQA